MSINKFLRGSYWVTTLTVEESLAFSNPKPLLLNFLAAVHNEPTYVSSIVVMPIFYTLLDIADSKDKWLRQPMADTVPDRPPSTITEFCGIPIQSSMLGDGVIAEFRRGADIVAQILTSEEFDRRKKQP